MVSLLENLYELSGRIDICSYIGEVEFEETKQNYRLGDLELEKPTNWNSIYGDEISINDFSLTFGMNKYYDFGLNILGSLKAQLNNRIRLSEKTRSKIHHGIQHPLARDDFDRYLILFIGIKRFLKLKESARNEIEEYKKKTAIEERLIRMEQDIARISDLMGKFAEFIEELQNSKKDEFGGGL